MQYQLKQETKVSSPASVSITSKQRENMETLPVLRSESGLIEIESPLPQEQIQGLFELFEPYALQARDKIAAFSSITVADENDVDGIESAKAAKKELSELRKELDETHKEHKAGILAQTRAIDGIRKIIKDRIVESEAELKELADTAKRAEQERRESLIKERQTELAPYLETGQVVSGLGDMDDSTYQTILQGMKDASDKRAQEAELLELRAEKQRMEDEAKRKEELEKAEKAAKVEARRSSVRAALLDGADFPDWDLESMPDSEFADKLRELIAIKTETQQALVAAEPNPVAGTIEEVLESRPVRAGMILDNHHSRTRHRVELAQELLTDWVDSMDADLIMHLEGIVDEDPVKSIKL